MSELKQLADKPFTWSFSQLKGYETCPRRYYHYNVAKDVVELETSQLAEGNALHEAFHKRISKGVELPLGMTHHEPLLAKIVSAPGETYAEQKLALTEQFTPVGFFGKNVWFRTVIDAAKINGDSAIVFDWKTGKPSIDETQMQLVSATMLHHMPKLNSVKAALIFVNYGETERSEYLRSDLPSIWGEVLPRVRKLKQAREDNDFPPKPGGLCRRYCNVVSCEYHGKGG